MGVKTATFIAGSLLVAYATINLSIIEMKNPHKISKIENIVRNEERNIPLENKEDIDFYLLLDIIGGCTLLGATCMYNKGESSYYD